MNDAAEHYLHDVMAGARRELSARLLRVGLAGVEPIYRTAVVARNALFDAGWKPAHDLGRPTISIGNLTAGGTGKTPLVRWLASRLRQAGHTPAILSRGYKSTPGELGDEQRMLDRLLNGPGLAPVALYANPSRQLAAARALADAPGIDCFLLDDGFQHRRARRDLDIVLISAINPFGFGHMLPRGLLREPLSGLRRAHAVVITHANMVDRASIEAIMDRVRCQTSDLPVMRCAHQPTGLRNADTPASAPPAHALAHLSDRPFFAFCGLGNPQALHRSLQQSGAAYVGHRWFADHFAYTPAALADVQRDARALGAKALVTTEKDWAKIAGFPPAVGDLPILRIDVELVFEENDEQRLLDLAERAIATAKPQLDTQRSTL